MRPDRPPGRDEGGHPTQSDRLHNTPTPSPPGAEVVPQMVQPGTGSGRDVPDLAPCCILAVRALLAAMPDPAAVDEHWLRICREMTAHAARAGHGVGYRTGYERAVTQWKITAAGMTDLGGPTYAEQDRRRYPPGGRESWKQPKLGDLYECWAAWSGEADGGEAA